MGCFTVAGLQLDLHAEDNLARIAAEVAAAKRRFPWIDMIILSELAAYGPNTGRAQAPGGRAESAFCEMARDNAVFLLPGSSFEVENGRISNVALVIDPAGMIVARYRKMFPFRPYEEGVTPGDSFCVVPIAGAGCLGVSICYDLWFPEITRNLAWMGAEALICPSLTDTIDRDVELSLARANAAANQCYVINVNAGSPMGMGQSIVCGPGGEVIHLAGSGYEVFVVELDFDYVARVRRQGWQGLGQPLKSFRDRKVRFPAYQAGAESLSLDELGTLAKPVSKLTPRT